MLTQAGAQREKLPPLVRERLSFLEHDIRTIRLGEQFDVVVALFHVISYQTSNEDVLLTPPPRSAPTVAWIVYF